MPNEYGEPGINGSKSKYAYKNYIHAISLSVNILLNYV